MLPLVAFKKWPCVGGLGRARVAPLVCIWHVSWGYVGGSGSERPLRGQLRRLAVFRRHDQRGTLMPPPGREVRARPPQIEHRPKAEIAEMGAHAFSRVGGRSPRSRSLNRKSEMFDPPHLLWPRCSRSNGQGASSREAVDLQGGLGAGSN